ncbi:MULTISPECIES: DsbA family protein [unclassified Pseudomonas]|uniref:DsbA family protein n=1 Tax=unclassified Pseudomonas TaxID=196821 RepID=UPI0005B84489|nr:MULTISPECIES: DsbA family protein [unclassified Pseudomonas]SMF19657.1 Protein-disulfide isomerase [Pseudomonas sp. LAMO17WK12:I1]
MKRPSFRKVILGSLMSGLSLACIVFIRNEMKTPNHTGPWVYGSPDARWTVTEYADLECPYCKTYTPALKEWVQQQKDVNLRWHHLPLDFHGPVAIHEARLVECAATMGGEDVFWQAIDQTFARTRSNGQGISGQLDVNGISNQDLEDCATNNTGIAQYISRQAEDAIKAGITATPTILIKDNTTGRSIKIEGPADSVLILSAIDRLAQVAKKGVDGIR